MIKRFGILVLACLAILSTSAQRASYNIIPLPKEVKADFVNSMTKEMEKKADEPKKEGPKKEEPKKEEPKKEEKKQVGKKAENNKMQKIDEPVRTGP